MPWLCTCSPKIPGCASGLCRENQGRGCEREREQPTPDNGVGRLRGIPDVHKALVLLVSRKESETPQIPCLNCLKLLPLSFSVPIPSVLPLGSHPQCSPSAGKSYQNLPEEGSIGESGRGATKSGKSRQKKATTISALCSTSPPLPIQATTKSHWCMDVLSTEFILTSPSLPVPSSRPFTCS